MKKLIALLTLTCSSTFAAEQVPYGVAFPVDVCLYDATDGTTPEDALTFADADVIFTSDGTEENVGSDLTINDNGNCYDVTVDATRAESAHYALQFQDDAGGPDWLSRDYRFVTTGHPDAGIPCPANDCISSGTAQVSTASTFVAAATTSFADNFLNGAMIYIADGTGAGQTRLCSETRVSTTDTCSLQNDWDVTIDATSKYFIYPEKRGFILTDANGRLDIFAVGGTTQTAGDLAALINALNNIAATDIVSAGAITTLSGAVANVDLVDTTTANTDMRGTDSANTVVPLAAATDQAEHDATQAAERGTDGANTTTPPTVNDIWNTIIETSGGTYTASCAMAIGLAYQAGTWTTSGGVSTFRDPGGVANRLVGTISASSRGSITITCP